MLIKSKTNFLHLSHIIKFPLRKFIYFDSSEIERNLPFAFNLGYNKIPLMVKSNIGPIKNFQLATNGKLVSNIKDYYKTLLTSLEGNEIENMEEILEQSLKYSLYQDMKDLIEKQFTVRVINPDSPLTVKFLSYYELGNVSLDRNSNGEIDESQFNYDNNFMISIVKKKQDNVYSPEVERERKFFEQSHMKELALNNFTCHLNNEYNKIFSRKILGNNAKQKDITHVANLIQKLNNNEENNENDQFVQEFKREFSNYYKEKQRFIEEKTKTEDLYLYFKTNMPSHHTKMMKAYKSTQSLFKSFVNLIRKKFVRAKRTKIDKKTIVIDVEIKSKMRLEIQDLKGNNVLNTVYNYNKLVHKKLNESFKSDPAQNGYDSAYRLKPSDERWNVDNLNFTQSHLLRFEYEQQTRSPIRSLFSNPLKTLLITDIDMALKGNRHFKFKKEYL